MKFTPLVYTLVLSMVLPPPHVFAAEANVPTKTYVQRIKDLTDEATALQEALKDLIKNGSQCGPNSWPKPCGGKPSPQQELASLNQSLAEMKATLNKGNEFAIRLDAPIAKEKVEATTACAGGKAGLGQDESERQAAGEKLLPLFKEVEEKLGKYRKRYNEVTAGFIPMVRGCAGTLAMMASDSDFPAFAGEGFVMLYEPGSTSTSSCDPHAAVNAAAFFVDSGMRRTGKQSVQGIYNRAGKNPSKLEAFESSASTYVKNLQAKIKELKNASAANLSQNKTDCSSLAAKGTDKPGTKDPEKKSSDISGTEKPGGSKTAEIKKAEEEAAAKAAEEKAKLNGDKKDLPVVKNNTGSQTGTEAAKAILTDEKGNALVATGEETPEHTRASEEDVKAEKMAGQKNYPKDQIARSEYLADANSDPNHKKYVEPAPVKDSPARDFDHDIDPAPTANGAEKVVKKVEVPTADQAAAEQERANQVREQAARNDAVGRDAEVQRLNEQLRIKSEEIDTYNKYLTKGAGSGDGGGGGGGGGGGDGGGGGRQVTGGGDGWGVAQPVADQNKKTDEGGISATGAIVGIAALGAIGGGIYMATRSKKSSSSGGGALIPAPAPAPTPAETATSVITDTSVNTATQTATATSSNTVTSTNTGVSIDLGPLNGTGTRIQTSTQTSTLTDSGSYTTITATQTQTSTSTATNGINWGNIDTGAGGGGDVHRANVKVNSSGAAYYVPKAGVAPAPAPARR